ncbi:MAG: F0F1 ATP synthase subunit gamma [Burkholderiaceae bacterium]|nr:MAG: F0F1 ATP synthase subunit gamma [Burkholderiaceae bacterium]
MASGKEIRTKIKSVQNTRKITKAMEMVAASKMRKAQDRMRAARPYAEKIRHIAINLAHANPEYVPPYLATREQVRAAGMIVVTTDKGLCGGLNTNSLRVALNKYKELQAAGAKVSVTAIGNKGLGFFHRLGANVVSSATHLGDKPQLEKLLGAILTQLAAYEKGEIDALYLVYADFINTMKQEPTVVQLLPLPSNHLQPDEHAHSWDYIYEPDAPTVIDELLKRYIEALIYKAVAENMASEQSARMVAMKSASDNAKKVIGDLQLVYNKTRQAAITKELSEIVGGAAAIG